MRSSCPLCMKESALFFSTTDRNRRITQKIFYYYRCPDCRLVFLSPIPDNLGEYYPNTYYSFPSSPEQQARAAEPERYKIDIVQQFASHGGCLLEIGPAVGNFSYLAKQAGYAVEAIEMDPACCKHLENVVGIKVINSDNPADALKKTGKYDVITLWHVIEHLPDPWSTMRIIADKLLPNGILVIAAPNPDAFQFQVLGRYWPHVDAPRHVELIPMTLLAKQASLLGLNTLWTTTDDKGTLGWNIFGWEVFFTNLSDIRFIKRKLRKIGRLISMIVGPIERVNGHGSAYTAVFQKGQQK